MFAGRKDRACLPLPGVLLVLLLTLTATTGVAAAATEDTASPQEDTAPGQEMAEPAEEGAASAEETGDPIEEPVEAVPSFSDAAPEDWYYEAMSWCVENGVLQDLPMYGAFEPDSSVTRAAFTDMLARMVDADLTWTGETVYGDIQPGSFYYEAVSWAGANGLAGGYADGTFHPGELLTRQQGAALLARVGRFLGYDTTPTDSSAFAASLDARNVDVWARKDVKWCLQTGLMAGNGGYLLPASGLTRAQAVQLLYRFRQWLSTAQPATSTIPARAPTTHPENHAALQAQIDKIAARYGADGLSVAYVKDGVVVDTFAYGAACKGVSAMTADSKLRIASISKVLVGTAAHLAAQEGRFNLDGDIGQYLNVKIRVKRSGDVVTPRSILTHTSSLVVAGEGTPCDIQSVRSQLASSSATRNVTSGNLGNWAYNNYAFSVLGLAVEQAEQRTLDELLYEYVYGPLNIDAAFYAGEVKDPSLLAEIYRANGAVGLSYAYQSQKVSDGLPGTNGATFAGGVAISAFDLGKIVAMLANDGTYDGVQCLTPELVSALEQHASQAVSGGFYQGQPLRYRANTYGQSALYYHTGSAYGVYNLISYNPDTKAGVVVLASGASATKDGYGIYAVCGEISKMLYQGE